MTTTVADLESLHPERIAQVAVGRLASMLIAPATMTQAFGGVQMGKKFLVPTIETDEAREMSTEGGAVTDATNSSDSVELPLKHIYWSGKFSINSLASGAGNFVDQIVNQGVVRILDKLDNYAFERLTRNASLAISDNGSYNMNKETFNDAVSALFSGRVPQQDRFAVLTDGQANKLLDRTANPEFGEFNTAGVFDIQSGAEPRGLLRTFRPWMNHNVFSDAAASNVAAANGAIVSTSATTIALDGMTAERIKVGHLIQIGTEEMLVTGVPATAGYIAGNFTVIRGFGGSTAATALDNAQVNILATYNNFFYQKESINWVFANLEIPAALRPSNMDMSSAEYNGIRLFVQRQAVDNEIGSVRYIFHTMFGCEAIRPAAVMKMVSKT